MSDTSSFTGHGPFERGLATRITELDQLDPRVPVEEPPISAHRARISVTTFFVTRSVVQPQIRLGSCPAMATITERPDSEPVASENNDQGALRRAQMLGASVDDARGL